MKKNTIALASAMIVSPSVPSRATSSCSALAAMIPAVNSGIAPARLEPGAGGAERDVERQHAGAVGLDDRERQCARADPAEEPPVRALVDVPAAEHDREAEQRHERHEHGEHDQPLAVERRPRVLLQRGRDDQDRQHRGEERENPADRPDHGANDRPPCAPGHRRAGGSQAQPEGGARLEPRADVVTAVRA
jgi:hypothetical protein